MQRVSYEAYWLRTRRLMSRYAFSIMLPVSVKVVSCVFFQEPRPPSPHTSKNLDPTYGRSISISGSWWRLWATVVWCSDLVGCKHFEPCWSTLFLESFHSSSVQLHRSSSLVFRSGPWFTSWFFPPEIRHAFGRFSLIYLFVLRQKIISNTIQSKQHQNKQH